MAGYFVNAQNPTITVTKKSYNGADESCHNANNAELTINASGGSGGYQYSIDNGSHYYSNNIFSGLTTGQNYQILAKDNSGKKSNTEYIYLNSVPESVTINNVNITSTSCAAASDGQLGASAHGGTGTITFSIDNGATYQTSGLFKNLSPGSYTILAKDLNNCIGAKTVVVGANPGVNISVWYQANYDCNSWSTGAISFGGSNGSGSYSLFLDGAPSGGSASGLSFGTHTLSVIDGAGCSASQEITITAPLTATISGDTAVNINGYASLEVEIQHSSGSGPYTVTYQNSLGQTFTETMMKGVNFINVGPVTQEVTYSLVSLISPGCTGRVKGSAKVSIDDWYVWKGINTDWNDDDNWNFGNVPALNSKVRIPLTPNNPVISGNHSAKRIDIKNGAQLTITGRLNLTAEITSVQQNSVDATAGTINFCGTTLQEFGGNLLKDYAIKNVMVGNNVNLQDSLNVYGNIVFPETGKTFNTAHHLTLKSTAEGTAGVGKLANGNSITGQVTVEHYFPAKKGWKFTSVATNGSQTIHDAWQEGQPAGNTTGIQGYGIQLTNSITDWAAEGFDGFSASPSIKTHNTATNLWEPLPSTLTPFQHPSNSYMVFVRGDRSANDVNSPEVPTVLRTKGILKTGDQPVITVTPDKFVAVGNPYPSDIDLTKFNAPNNMFFYVWDQYLGTSYGAYQTFMKVNSDTYMAVPGGGTYDNLSENFIQAGQAFFAFCIDGGTLQLTENSKTIDNLSVNSRLMGQADNNNSDNLTIKLYNQDGVLVDGIFQRFNSHFSNDIDGFDALKSANSTENLSIKRAGKLLAVESRAIADYNDTTTLNFTGMSYMKYAFQINLSQTEDSRDVLLTDNYTGRQTPINNGQVTTYEFEVTKNAASYAANRFTVVYAARSALPVTFTSVKAERQEEVIIISWVSENEKNVAGYVVEKSADGNHFNSLTDISSSNTSSYQFTDAQPLTGANYYRVVSVDKDGKKGYSAIVRANMPEPEWRISIYPNPVVGNKVNVRLNVQAKGIYHITIANQSGQLMDSRQINFDGRQTHINIIPASKLKKGVYTMDVTHPTGVHSVIRFMK